MPGFHADLCTYITSGLVMSLELEAPDAVTKWRSLMSPVDQWKTKRRRKRDPEAADKYICDPREAREDDIVAAISRDELCEACRKLLKAEPCDAESACRFRQRYINEKKPQRKRPARAPGYCATCECTGSVRDQDKPLCGPCQQKADKSWSLRSLFGDRGVCKNTQNLPEPHKTKEACDAAGYCEWSTKDFYDTSRGDDAMCRRNAVHGADSPKAAAKEIALIFDRKWKEDRRRILCDLLCQTLMAELS